MTWDSKANKTISTATLMASSPENVYQQLREYGAVHSSSDDLSGTDESLEKALLGRADPLINLGLAQFAGSYSIVRLLYTEATNSPGNSLQDRAIRLAVLSNRVWPAGYSFKEKVLSTEEVKRIVETGEREELTCLLTNPALKYFLGYLFNRKPPFDNLPSDRLAGLVQIAMMNPGLNGDDGNEFGPDLEAWDIQKGVFALLETAPVDSNWGRILAYLLYRLDRRRVGVPDADPRPVFDRRRTLPPPEKRKRPDDMPPGHWTSTMEPNDEFLCLMATLFGCWSSKEDGKLKFTYLGSLHDQDVLMRYAFYGRERTLTVDQMDAAHTRDGEGFLLAALCNTTLFWKKHTRAKLEQLLEGNLRFLYHRRCQEIHSHHPEFDPKPVSEAGTKLLDDVVEDEKPSEELEHLNALDARLHLLQVQLTRLQKYATWTVAIIAIVVVLLLIKR